MNITHCVELPDQKPGPAEKIARLFMERKETSLVRDINPILRKEYRFRVLDEELCAEAAAEIERALRIAQQDGHIMNCAPRFAPRVSGEMFVSDIVYKRVEPPIIKQIGFRLEGMEKS